MAVDDCKTFIACLSKYFEGEIDDVMRVEFERHLMLCSNARAMLHTFERTIILHRMNRGQDLPEGLHERLLAAIEKCAASDDD
jgi:predicted anti-sigma-YlaC factor YlaD